MEKSIAVTVKGVSPLLMHSFPMVPIEALEKKSPEEQVKFSLYMNNGKIYVPGTAIQRALISAAVYSKGRGRGNLSRIVAACVFVSPEVIVLPEQKYEIDARPVVIPATKGRVIRYRPRFDNWQLDFNLSYNPDLITEQQMRRVMDDAGARVGLLDYRPEKKGPFGRFAVVTWKS